MLCEERPLWSTRHKIDQLFKPELLIMLVVDTLLPWPWALPVTCSKSDISQMTHGTVWLPALLRDLATVCTCDKSDICGCGLRKDKVKKSHRSK